MSYQALYRVWRPQTFADMVGQEAVSRTLRNAIRNRKTSHAYLFTGPRGTGKTSAAKIFAKAINCPNQTDGEPCNECEICRAITAGTLSDVNEIDAASNNGVEEIRDIRDKARYAPTEAPYKVYIIDEVHMLSTGAFNALLKTLEEPPANVIFILATTEPHKLPATIISRTQRFDFKRISNNDIESRLDYILQQEGIEYEAGSLAIIARAANGGMRDALSLLDQVISFSEAHLSLDMVRAVTGSLSEDQLIEYLRAIAEGNVQHGLEVLRQMLQAGQEASRLVEEVLLFVRDVLLAKEVDDSEASELTQPFTQDFYDLAKTISLPLLYAMMQNFRETQQEMRFSQQTDIYLEVVTIKLAQFEFETENRPVPLLAGNESSTMELSRLEALEKQVQQLQQQISRQDAGSVNVQAPKSDSVSRSTNSSHNFKPNTEGIYKTLASATKTDLNKIVAIWDELVQTLPNIQSALLKQTKPAAASPDHFVLSFDYVTLCQKVAEDKALQQAVEERIQQQTGSSKKMLVISTEQWQDLRARYVNAMKAGTLTDLMGESGNDHHPGSTTDTEAFSGSQEDQSTLAFGAESDQGEEIVNQAVALFGAENVTIVED